MYLCIMAVLFAFKVLHIPQEKILRKLPETARNILLSHKDSEAADIFLCPGSLMLQDR